MREPHALRNLLLASVALSSAGSAARAAGAPAAAEAAAAPPALEQVVVTAERRTQNLQTVPIAATVFDSEQLAKQGVTRVADLQQVSPSLSITTNGRSTFVNIRGIGLAQTAPTTSPGVAFYVNGALLPHEQTIAGSFYDLAAVEVLRGPQGTLSGQNSTGGAIYVRTPEPRFGDLSGYVEQTLGTYQWSRTIGAANIPLIEDKAALRVAAVRDVRDSYTDNIGGPANPGDLNFTGYRADLRLRPFERLEGNLRYEHYLTDTDYLALKSRNDRVTQDPFVIEEDALSFSRIEGYRFDAELKYDITDAIRLRYQGNSQNTSIGDLSDGDRTATAQPRPPASNVGRVGTTSSAIKTITHEVNLLSTDAGPAQWIVGAFYLSEKRPVVLKTFNNDIITNTHPPTATTFLLVTNESEAVFGQLAYTFNPQWQLVAGGRYTRDTQDMDRIIANVLGLTSTTSKVPTGRIALNFTPKSDTLVYLSVARGYKSGGNNQTTRTPFKPEINVVEELGFKTDGFDHRVRVNADVFASQYEDLQLQSRDQSNNTVTQNVPRSRTYGAEVEAQAVLGDLRLNGGLAFLDAKTDTTVNLLDPTVTPSVLRSVPSGSRLPFSPETTLNAGAEYDFHLGDGTLTPRIQVSYVDTSYVSVFRNANSILPRRTLLDARLTWKPNGRWLLEAFGTNLTDETFISSQSFGSSSADGGTQYGARREVGVRLKVNLGAD